MEKEKFIEFVLGLWNHNQLSITGNLTIKQWIEKEWDYYNTTPNLDREEELVKFMIWYKNSVPIGTSKPSKEIVSEYLKTIEQLKGNINQDKSE